MFFEIFSSPDCFEEDKYDEQVKLALMLTFGEKNAEYFTEKYTSKSNKKFPNSLRKLLEDFLSIIRCVDSLTSESLIPNDYYDSLINLDTRFISISKIHKNASTSLGPDVCSLLKDFTKKISEKIIYDKDTRENLATNTQNLFSSLRTKMTTFPVGSKARNTLEDLLNEDKEKEFAASLLPMVSLNSQPNAGHNPAN